MRLSSPSTLLDRHSLPFTPWGTRWGGRMRERDGPPSPWDKGALQRGEGEMASHGDRESLASPSPVLATVSPQRTGGQSLQSHL